jgi:hypothetical protein
MLAAVELWETRILNRQLIDDILRNINVPVASDTVVRLCHEILGEPMTRRHKRRKVPSRVPRKRACQKPREVRITATSNKTHNETVPGTELSTGAHIADANTI